MADLSQTAANVRAKSGATISSGLTAGEAITAGAPVYKKEVDGKYYLAKTTSSEQSHARGIAITNASLNDPLIIVTAGSIDVGATLTVGTIYVVSENAGKICPAADIGSGEYVCVLGIAKAAGELALNIHHTGVAAA